MPLPFGYPARRCVPVNQQRHNRAFYHVQVWPWAVGGLREQLGYDLRRALGDDASVGLFYEGQQRPGVRAYWDRLQRATVSVVPAGHGYFTNRLFESLAAGCAVVAEAPTMTFPGALVDDLEWVTFRNEMDAVDAAQRLIAEPEEASAIASAGQCALRERHSTEVRARAVWRAMGMDRREPVLRDGMGR